MGYTDLDGRNFTHSDLPSVTSEGSAKVEVSDVKKLSTGDSNMLGAVIVGGVYGADCFEDVKTNESY